MLRLRNPIVLCDRYVLVNNSVSSQCYYKNFQGGSFVGFLFGVGFALSAHFKDPDNSDINIS